MKLEATHGVVELGIRPVQLLLQTAKILSDHASEVRALRARQHHSRPVDPETLADNQTNIIQGSSLGREQDLGDDPQGLLVILAVRTVGRETRPEGTGQVGVGLVAPGREDGLCRGRPRDLEEGVEVEMVVRFHLGFRQR